ncbi:uncharacterized protein LOC129608265 [Condylostylus longicornis]|uniref:uncharacterized protein LOC129608265 n=1 Tax=Condylostylus longicornis TaxID=2530218 RepID=UPI00244DD028|nr:uncharacterized protein LOC129608265 [Condylostylus longicornis]
MSKTRGSIKSEIKSFTATKLEEEPVKVFLIHRDLFEGPEDLAEIEFLKLRNPGTEKLSYYALDSAHKQFYQLMQFNQPNRSFFIDDFVSSDGKVYITQPLDIKFLFLYYIRKYASNKAIAIDQIYDAESSVTVEILSKYANKEELEKICDIKEYSNDLFFVKYNQIKSLAWLSLVTKKIVDNLKKAKINTGGAGAQSANYEKSSFLDENVSEDKILTYAWGVIGTFLTEDLHLELANYMKVTIPAPKSVIEEPKKQSGKRKPLEEVDDEINNKKLKMEVVISSPEQNTQKVKEKLPTMKEKQLAKAASGTKSIMSFFKK